MVNVVAVNEQSLQFSMEDGMSGAEEKKHDAEFLPSMGLGALVTNPDDARSLMARIRRADSGMTLPADSRTSVQKPGSASYAFQSSDDPLRQGTRLRPTHPQQEKTATEPKPGPSHEPDFPYKGKLTGKTTPIEAPTIDMEQFTGLSDNELPKTDLYDVLTSLPQLEVRPAEYTRFRYASERPEKGKKVRQYEMDEDKRFVADVKVNNYQGSATVIMHCVDNKGKLHPYHLDGEDCVNGVFYKRFEFSAKNKTLRILKATVIQPKAKEYEKSLAAQKAFLLQNKAIDGTDQVCKNPQDKQCVHFHVKVYLDDGDGPSYLNTITHAIRNKKDGNEFKIYTITPPSAMATGEVLKHLGNRVHIIVTNETAFPKEVSVVFRHTEISWEVELSGNQITVLKKAVVEFTPPPYPDTSITENVTVDVCLKDKIAGKETLPAKFMYIRDEYGLSAKRTKKRKLEDLNEFFQSSYAGSSVQGQKRFLSDLSTGTLQTLGPDRSSFSDEETPHNSLGFVKESSMACDETQPEHADVQNFNRDVSLGEQRTNGSGNLLLQQTGTAIETQAGVNYNLQLGNEGNIQPAYDVRSSGQVVTSAESALNNKSPKEFGGQSSTLGENSQLSQVQDQSAGIPQTGNFDPDFTKQLSPELLVRLVDWIQNKRVSLTPESEELVWQRVSDLLSNQTTPSQINMNQTAQVQNVQLPGSNQQPAQAVQSLSELPALPADCHYAIIQGQIMVVKNDLHESNQSAQYGTTNMSGITDTMATQQPSQQAQTNIINAGEFTQNFGEQDSSTLGGAPGSFVQTNQIVQPGQPPAAFWRATTGTSSNLDDDDVEIDTVIDCPNKNDTNDSSNQIEEVEEIVDAKIDSGIKTHGMKLRGKKLNYKDTFLGKKGFNAHMDEDDLENVDDEKYIQQKCKYTESSRKKSQRRGKALYEDDGGRHDDDDDYDDDDDCKDDGNGKEEPKEEPESKVRKPDSYRYRKGSKGKDLKKVKRMIVEDWDESSQGFDCSDDS